MSVTVSIPESSCGVAWEQLCLPLYHNFSLFAVHRPPTPTTFNLSDLISIATLLKFTLPPMYPCFAYGDKLRLRKRRSRPSWMHMSFLLYRQGQCFLHKAAGSLPPCPSATSHAAWRVERKRAGACSLVSLLWVHPPLSWFESLARDLPFPDTDPERWKKLDSSTYCASDVTAVVNWNRGQVTAGRRQCLVVCGFSPSVTFYTKKLGILPPSQTLSGPARSKTDSRATFQ